VRQDRRLARAALAAALLVGSVPLRAAENDGARVQIEQKLKLVARLISDSPSAQRITASGNAQAVAQLDEGRVHHALAIELLAKGDLAGASKAADEALRHLSTARRQVPDAGARQAIARQRYEQLLGSVERLIVAWRARSGGDASARADDMTAALGLVSVAKQRAQEGQYEEAHQALSQAERHVLSGMTATLNATTLDYTVRAASPLEDFQNELARHQGLAELVPLAVRDLQPRPDALALIERYGQTSSQLHGQALQQFQAGDIPQALVHLRNATLYVQRALLAAGLVAPQPTGTPP
jgi:tetratricopeptide (TPR) repeat protein